MQFMGQGTLEISEVCFGGGGGCRLVCPQLTSRLAPTWLSFKVLPGLASHVGLLLNPVEEGQVEGLGMFWSEETLKFSFWEETEKLFPFKRLFPC